MGLLVFILTLSVVVIGMQGCAGTHAGGLLPVRSGVTSECIQHTDAGIDAYHQGQLDVAKQRFESAIQASPASAEAHYNLGMVLYRLGAEEEAIQQFTNAAALAPGDSVIWSAPGVDRRAVEAFKRSNHGHAHSH